MRELPPSPPAPPRRVYGPVPSRRLGTSLGLDLVPFKTCTYDCVYCQLGRTRRTSLDRKPFAPVAELIEETGWALARGPQPCVITLAGSGEPTLYQPLEDLMGALKTLTSIPIALLTNGALFWQPEVRRAARGADIVLPSLDAGDDGTFQSVNRPHEGLELEQVVEGLAAFRSGFHGQIWLEVMLVAGLNDRTDQVRAIAALARRLRPDRIQLNTPLRPSALGLRGVVPPRRLASLCPRFTPVAEVIGGAQASAGTPGITGPALVDRLLALLARRPCTLQDAAQGLSAPPNEVVKAAAILQSRGAVASRRMGDQVFFVARPKGG